MASDSFKIKKSLNLEPGAPTMDAEGDIGVDSSTHKLKFRDNSSTKNVVTEDGTATLTNKTFDADGTGNSITNIENADIKAAAAIALNKLAAATASRALVSDGSGFVSAATTTATEIGYVNGVTSAIQTQINTKAPAASPTFTGTVTTPITASRALVTGAGSELAASATTATELGYVNGVTSAIQTQINNITGGQFTSSGDIQNLGLACSVGSSALTISLKQADGSAAPAAGASSVKISFRDATAANGDYTVVSATAATTLVVSSGSTLGNASAVESFLWVYAINNAGTIELGVSSSLFDEGTVQSSTAEGGAGAADSNAVLYSTTARTSKAIRIIGRLRSTQSTAGTWAAVPTEISLVTPGLISASNGVTARYSATSSATIPTSATTFIFGTKTYDSHNAMNAATGVYTVPVSGKYQVSAFASAYSSVLTDYRAEVLKDGSTYSNVYSSQQVAASFNMPLNISDDVDCVAGTTLAVRFWVNGQVAAFTTPQWITIKRVGN